MPDDPDSVLQIRDGRSRLLVDATRLPPSAPPPGFWLVDPNHYAALGEEAARLQAAGRGSVLFIRFDGADWVLRRYRRGGLPGKLVDDRYLWSGIHRTRPWREFRLLQRLRQQGFPVPVPVAAAVWPRAASYRGALLMERIADAEPLQVLLAEAPLPAAQWQAVGALLGRLHAAGVHHPDVNVANILQGADGTLHLIDFDRATESAPEWLLAAGLARLRRSLRKHRNAPGLFHYDDVGDWQALEAAYREARGAGGAA